MEPQILATVDEHTSYFRSFIKLLAEKFQPLQIYCISKSFSFNGSAGCFKTEAITRKANYCLLMVTETNTRVDHEVQDYTSHMYEDGDITVLCHGKEAIADAIAKNNRFFITAQSKGNLLFSNDGMGMFWPNLKYHPENAALKAERHFTHHKSLAEGFLDGARTCLTNQQYNVCTFMLHQVVEQSCIGLIRVFLAYRSEVHNLNRLLRLCNCFSDIPYNWFFTGRIYEQRLFDILVKSYSQARYGRSFIVEEIDAKCLYEKVSTFVALANEMCALKISEVNEIILKLESEVSNG